MLARYAVDPWFVGTARLGRTVARIESAGNGPASAGTDRPGGGGGGIIRIFTVAQTGYFVLAGGADAGAPVPTAAA